MVKVIEIWNEFPRSRDHRGRYSCVGVRAVPVVNIEIAARRLRAIASIEPDGRPRDRLDIDREENGIADGLRAGHRLACRMDTRRACLG